METPYRLVTMKRGDIITRDTLDQLNSNLQFIKDNTPRGRVYRGGNLVKDADIVIMTGRVSIAPRKSDSATVNVKFPKGFHADCLPAVTVGTISNTYREVYCVLSGPGSANYPNSSGFQAKVTIPGFKNIQEWMIIHWSAMGWGAINLNEF